MVRFTAVIEKFEQKGEKSGWTYIAIPEELAQELKPGNKKSFRVKGKLDNYAFSGLTLLPMGDGNFILPLKAEIRREIGKNKGSKLLVQMTEDKTFKIVTPEDLTACLADEPGALQHFEKMAPSHRNYFIKWIDEAKTDATRTKRIAMTVEAMRKGMDYGAMIRNARQQ
ncbi:YdeI/OmpD-associated family protein [Filimonas effusa]|uniref:DUF1905 domain-containing protein n=1 Tax=Filimonas effusa TaxID=2508721 RepID=A0A4Q1D4G9_9BACT|nr:YdeI/OmpD-associated family protein [Filimonas effusa]RXK82826.1 DUF1905 domain-containing protein [Filimonas effusa]